MISAVTGSYGSSCRLAAARGELLLLPEPGKRRSHLSRQGSHAEEWRQRRSVLAAGLTGSIRGPSEKDVRLFTPGACRLDRQWQHGHFGQRRHGPSSAIPQHRRKGHARRASARREFLTFKGKPCEDSLAGSTGGR